jgi:hypothetical protein
MDNIRRTRTITRRKQYIGYTHSTSELGRSKFKKAIFTYNDEKKLRNVAPKSMLKASEDNDLYEVHGDYGRLDSY